MCCFLTSIFSGFGLDFGASWASKSAALLAAPGVLKPTAFMLALTDCFSFLRGGQSGPNSRVNLAVFSTSWLIFHYWPVLDLPWVCLGLSYDVSGMTFLAFLDIVHGLLHNIPAAIHFLLFMTTLQRGGTCAANPPPPEESAWRAE